ncbi:MAG: hypothetical protein K2L89_03375, partial [Muribaculaceae bacterium]|nr:hypothetical protein [Muribaculaceae bacterium]
YEYTDLDYSFKVTGQFNSKGYPVGKWVREDEDGERIYAFYSDQGEEEECYSIDDSTGDKVKSYWSVYKVSFNIGLFEYRSRFLLRSSADGRDRERNASSIRRGFDL